jgi:hypothetical protein
MQTKATSQVDCSELLPCAACDHQSNLLVKKAEGETDIISIALVSI